MSDPTEAVLEQLQQEIAALRRDLDALRRRVEDGDEVRTQWSNQSRQARALRRLRDAVPEAEPE